MTLLTTSDVHSMLGTGITVQVTDIATGKSVVRQWFQRHGHVWPSISEQCSEWYGCEPEAVDLRETDDGEIIAILGIVVAKYEAVR